MRVVSISYNPKYDQPDPRDWLKKLDFYMISLESLSDHCEVINIDMINREGELRQNGVRHIFLSNNSSFFQVNRFIKQLQADIVLVQGFLFPAAVIHLGLIKSSKTKIILQHHAERSLAGIKASMFKIASRYTDAYFFATRSMADEWKQRKLIPAAKKIFDIAEASSVFEFRSSSAKERQSFLWVGRMNLNKDPFTLVNAFAEYAGQNQNARLYVVFPPGELSAEVSALVREKRLEGNIELVGKVDRRDMQGWYERSEYIICSSHYEGCNISVIEGMSCGCIPVVTAIPSFSLHTHNSRIGFQFEPGNTAALVECLNKTHGLNTVAERDNVLEYYKQALSPTAVAKKIYSAMKDVAG